MVASVHSSLIDIVFNTTTCAEWRAKSGNMARQEFTHMKYTAWLVFACCKACIDEEFCIHYDTEGQSTTMLDKPRHAGSIPQSCPYLCQGDPLCSAVTFDRERDLCRLHYEYDGDNCISRVNTPGNMFWISKKHVNCANVSVMVSIFSYERGLWSTIKYFPFGHKDY